MHGIAALNRLHRFATYKISINLQLLVSIFTKSLNRDDTLETKLLFFITFVSLIYSLRHNKYNGM